MKLKENCPECSNPAYILLYTKQISKNEWLGFPFCKEHYKNYIKDHPTVSTNGLYEDGMKCSISAK